MALDVLVVDDEADIREIISDFLKYEGLSIRVAANSNQVLKEIENRVPSAIILDVWLQGSELDGLGLLEIIKKQYPLMPIVVISSHGTIDTAVRAIKMGAYDYLEKPFTHEKLIIVLKRACEASKLKRENIDLKSKVVDKTEFIGLSPVTSKIKNEILKVAPTSCRIMISGAVGSSKELVARLIHKQSKRKEGAFFVFNPTFISAEKVYQELFGESLNSNLSLCEKKICVLEASNNGTLYIEEVTNLSIELQTRLLKFLKEHTIIKSNGMKVKLDVRIITSTTKDIKAEISAGNFRQDLYYRLNVVSLVVPLLSERKEDIPLLTKYFVKQFARFSGIQEREFSTDAFATLQAYHWPGNVRQLRNVIEWTLIMNPPKPGVNEKIRSDMLPQDIINGAVSIEKPDHNLDMMSMPLREARELFERQYLSAQMNRFNNNISKTSTFVGMERSALHRKLKMLNIYNNTGKITNKEKNMALNVV